MVLGWGWRAAQQAQGKAHLGRRAAQGMVDAVESMSDVATMLHQAGEEGKVRPAWQKGGLVLRQGGCNLRLPLADRACVAGPRRWRSCGRQ